MGVNEKALALSIEASELFWSWGLVVNERLGIMVCFTCKQAIDSAAEGVMRHLEKNHSRKGHTIKKENPSLLSDLTRLLKGFNFLPRITVRNQPAGNAPIRGIKVHRGYHCPIELADGTECRAAYLKTSSLYKHVRKEHGEHPDRPTEKQLYDYTCDCQSVFGGTDRLYFTVNIGLLEEGRPGTFNAYSAFVGSAENRIPDSSKPHEEFRNEELPSILRLTEWHLYLDPYRGDPEDIVRLAHHPDRSAKAQSGAVERVLARLPGISDAWVAKVKGYWKKSTDWMRRVLNGYPM